MSDDKYTADELEFVDRVMIAAITGLAGDPEYPLEKIPDRARSLAVATLSERRKLCGPVLVLDEEGAKRLARLEAFYADAYRLVGFTDADPDAIRTNSVLMNLENNRTSLHECSSELANVSMANDALKRQNGELMTQVSPSTRAVLIRAATLIENLAEAVDDPVFVSQSKEEAAQIREFTANQVKPQTTPVPVDATLVERCKLALFKACCEPLGLPFRFDLLGSISADAFDAATRAVIAELASVPCDLPSVDKIVDAWSTHAATMVNPAGARGVRLMLEACITPVLAAKDARNAELEARDDEYMRLFVPLKNASLPRDGKMLVAQIERERLARDQRIAELEKVLNASGIGDGSGARNIWFAHLQRSKNWQDCDATREIFDASFDAGAQCARDFDKNRAAELLDDVGVSSEPHPRGDS